MSDMEIAPVAKVSRTRPVLAAVAVFGLVVVVAAAAILGGHVGSPAASGSAGAASEGASGSARGPVAVRWFLGLGSGSSASAAPRPEQAFVKQYNATNQGKVTLKLEIVPNANAYDVLKTEIAADNAPDIIGPVGVKGRNGFEGLFLDLAPIVARKNFDMSDFDQSAVQFFVWPTQELVSLPYLMYPGYIWYNKDLFAKAKLPPLPTRIGEKYQGEDWTWETLRELARKLTLDKDGNVATDPAFDSQNINQYGIAFQWADLRRTVSCFGGGSFVDADGVTARIPDVWRDALSWYYSAVWTDHISPNLAAINSTYLGGSNAQSSGHVAMNAAWAWSISSIASDPASAKVRHWDIAVMPSWNGRTSSPMDADTFTITKASKHPDQAFDAMVAIMADPALQKMYGGMPARKSLRQAYFDALSVDLLKIYPGNTVTWSVLSEMATVPAVPSHESNMPNFTQSDKDIAALWTQIQNTEGLDLNAELARLQQDLQADFDGSGGVLLEEIR